MPRDVVWASDLAIKALKAKPESAMHWAHDMPTECSHCGRPIVADAPYSPVFVGPFFSDTRDLASFTGVVCGGCMILRTKKAMNALSFAVITENAIYPIAKDIHKAWLFLDPPEPPFLAMHTSATMQHLCWRTPVTLSRDLIYLRRGPEVLVLRPQVIRQAVEIANTILERRLAAGDVKAFASIFAVFDRAMRAANHGLLNPRVLAAASSAERELLYQLTPGEIWALGFLLVKQPPVPTRPDPIDITL